MNAPSTPAAGVAVPASWTLPLLGLTKPPLTLNDRLSRWERASRTRLLRDLTIVAGRKVRIPKGLDRITVVLHYAPREVRERDEDNLVPTLKPCVDALVRPLAVIPNDSRDHHTLSRPIIHDATGEPGRLWLVVVDLAGTAGPETPDARPGAGSTRSTKETHGTP